MRYFFGFLITIGLIILLIILLFSGGGKKGSVPKTSKPLDSYVATNSSVSATLDGIVNYQGDHGQIRITVDRDNVTYEQIKGYDGEVVKSQRYANTQNAYDVFLHALEKTGFTLGDTNKALADERGYCPLGRRYIFELEQDSQTLERLWSTNCGGVKTYKGNTDLTLQLFENQVPDFDNLTANVTF